MIRCLITLSCGVFHPIEKQWLLGWPAGISKMTTEGRFVSAGIVVRDLCAALRRQHTFPRVVGKIGKYKNISQSRVCMRRFLFVLLDQYDKMVGATSVSIRCVKRKKNVCWDCISGGRLPELSTNIPQLTGAVTTLQLHLERKSILYEVNLYCGRYHPEHAFFYRESVASFHSTWPYLHQNHTTSRHIS